MPSARRPIIPAWSPNSAATTRTASRAGSSARARISARAGSSSISPAAITPPPITITSGLSTLTMFDSPTPSARPTVAIASRATGSPSCASSVTNGPVSSRPSSSASPSAVSGRRATRSDASRTSAEPDAITSRQPRFGQCPWHGGPSMSIDHVPELPAGADPAALQPPAEHDPAADPGPEREHHDVVRAAAGAVARLGEHRAVAVVVDRHRQPEPLGHHRLERHVRQWQVGGVGRGAGAPVERHRNAEADRLDLLVDLGAGLLDGLDDRRHEARLIEPERLTPDAVAHGEIGPDNACEELGAAEVDPDDAARS